MKRVLLFLIIIASIGVVSASDFNSTWNTTYLSTGSTDNLSIKLPLEASGTYDFTVWWGDGTNDTITAYDQANVTHTYSAQGEYDVRINGTIIGWRFNYGGDRLKLVNITNWGTLRLGNSGEYFYGCSNLNVGATDTLNLTGTTSLYRAFRECSGLTTLDVSSWDTSSVTSFYGAFRECSGLTTLDASSWDTSNVISFSNTFMYCYDLSTLDASSWDTSNVISFSNTFNVCIGLTTLNVSSWDTSSVTSFSNTFYKCYDLSTLDVSNWNVTSLTDATDMLYGVTLTNTSYDDLLYYWSLQSLQNDVPFGGGNSKYNCGDPATSRNDTLIGTYNWTITDGGLDTGGCVYYGTAAPNITSYAPIGSIYPEVDDSQIFNVTTDQTTNCTWYINGTQVQYNTSATEHTYTNTSLNGGGCNVTAVVNNTNGTDSQTWLFEVGADSITYIVLQYTPTNQSMITEWNVTRIGSNVTDWGIWLNYTFSGWQYYFRYTNGTEIMNQTASSNNESLWFNGSSLLPTGVYYINATSSTNYIMLYANEYALINNWTSDQTFQQIAANISNDVCYSYYNSTSGLWEAYRAGYTYGATNIIPKNCSVFVFVNGETTISATPNTGGVTIPQDAWFYGYLPGSSPKTLTEVETAMNTDGLDVWSLYAFDNATQAYTSTGSYSVDAGEGYAVYVNTTGEWKP